MDLNEVRRAMNAAIERHKEEMREKAMFVYSLAELINLGTARALGGKGDWPEIEEVFPSLFDAEKMQEERRLQKGQRFAEQFKAYAEAWNERIEEDGR